MPEQKIGEAHVRNKVHQFVLSRVSLTAAARLAATSQTYLSRGSECCILNDGRMQNEHITSSLHCILLSDPLERQCFYEIHQHDYSLHN